QQFGGVLGNIFAGLAQRRVFGGMLHGDGLESEKRRALYPMPAALSSPVARMQPGKQTKSGLEAGLPPLPFTGEGWGEGKWPLSPKWERCASQPELQAHHPGALLVVLALLAQPVAGAAIGLLPDIADIGRELRADPDRK